MRQMFKWQDVFLWIGYKKSLSVLSYVRLSILSNCCSEIIQLQLLRYLLQ